MVTVKFTTKLVQDRKKEAKNSFQHTETCHLIDCQTVCPIQRQLGPRPVHQFCNVVWIQRSMIEPSHTCSRHGPPTVKQQTRFVPDWQWPARVYRGPADQLRGQVIEGDSRLPAHSISQRDGCDVYCKKVEH